MSTSVFSVVSALSESEAAGDERDSWAVALAAVSGFVISSGSTLTALPGTVLALNPTGSSNIDITARQESISATRSPVIVSSEMPMRFLVPGLVRSNTCFATT